MASTPSDGLSQHSSGGVPPACEEYQVGLQTANSEISELKSKQSAMVWVRTAFFLAAAVCLLLGYGGETYRLTLLSIGWLAAFGFLIAIVVHEHLRLRKLQHQSDAHLYQRLLARLHRDWDQTPEEHLLPEFGDIDFADDLDVAGKASLLSLLSLAGTRPGRRTLQSWLLRPPTWEDVRKRQSAVKALQGERKLRLAIVRTVLASSDGTEDVYGLPQWASTPNWLKTHRIAHVLSYIGPALVLLGVLVLFLVAGRENPTGVNVGAGLIGAGFLTNILLTVFWGSWIHEIFQQVTGQHRAVYGFASVFGSFVNLPSDGGLLDSIRQTSVGSPQSATRGFAKLLTNVRLANLQRDPMLYIVYLLLQLVFAWDFRILKLFERWKDEFGKNVDEWFQALGRCEALISCATLADEYPSWAFPTDRDGPQVMLDAAEMGHPLLPEQASVANSLRMEADRPLVLVTGSNMAGKSTFMRAVGLNLLLARTGSPVCASGLKTPLYDLATSIRVRDSLRDGVSFFMAELQRLKEVVDVAEHRAKQGDAAPIFFLLDEILQGTNSRERQIAVASVVRKLLRFNAIGLLSTHDLDLASEQSVQEVSQIVHFREYFDNIDGSEVMRFDYKMRPGPTPTTNALKLLSLVGLTSAADE